MNVANLPPFWTVAIAIMVVLFIVAEFPRAGGWLLFVVVSGMLLIAKQKGVV